MTTITRESLARMFPRAQPAWLDAFERLAPALMQHYRFNRLDWCGMCGQIDAECDGLALARMEENMRMDAKSILRLYSYRLGVAIQAGPVFGKSYSSKEALARDLAFKPERLADVVYGGPHGREGTPPWRGSLYIGRGPMQESHLNNYRAAMAEIRKQPGGAACPDLVEQPELLASDTDLGVRDIFAQWKLKGLSRYAQRQDWTALSDVLNTGNATDAIKPHGLPRRLRATAKALAIWGADFTVDEAIADATPKAKRTGPRDPQKSRGAGEISGATAANAIQQGDSGEEVKRLQVRLAELGFHAGATDGEFGILTKRALVAFQAEHGLPADGVATPHTWEVLSASVPADLGARAQITAKDLAAAGSETVATTQRAKRWLAWTKGGTLFEIFDQYFNLGVADTAIAQAEKVKSLMARGADVAAGVPSTRGLLPALPSGAVVACVVVLCAAWALHGWFDRIEARRVADARSGAHLGRGKPTT